ncbi:VIT1/CCC1 transporter family protein [Shinella curvata]|uniref:VIT1/CCC1 transporter family protein n=1 Tax=Shinella curvata TaxID=1817964 RepID=A0ABT8XCY0_9HYPH|nr:VIT1/CCC1 transporter family protein [Shinella curvata]MCJ8054578.1 VIT1/CCC1 transporter family protein [Shinella curvata]MDO6121599.1 VIT1/CCC1 transporter family protein [Shinella curvata]
MIRAIAELLRKSTPALSDPAERRSATLAANDGIIATAGILEGLAGAGANETTLVMAATAATIAGMLGAGGAKWAEAATEREAQLSAIRQEAAEIRRQPQAELSELAAYYEEKGLNPQLAHEVATELMRRSPLKAQLESEHGILAVMSSADVIRATVGSAFAYALGAAIPLSITIAVPVRLEPGVILAAVAVALTLTSIVGARAGHLNIPFTLLRTLVIGIGTIAVSYLAGRIVF